MINKTFDNDPNTNSSFTCVKYSDESTNFLSRFINARLKNKINVGGENFFSRKKQRMMLLCLFVFVLIIFCSLKVLFNVNFVSLLKDLFSKLGTTKYCLFTILFGLCTFWFCDVIIRIWVLKVQVKDRIKNVTKFEWVSFSIISFIIQSITPFSIGSEPYAIWWLNKKGIPLKEAGAMIAVSSFCWFVGQFIVTWPSFIYLTVNNWPSIVSLKITGTYWAVLVGLFVDIFVALFIFGISYAKKFHYYVSLFINSVKHYLGLPYSTKEETFKKYLEDNIFQKLYVNQLRQKSTIVVIVLYILSNLWVYLLFVFVYRLFHTSSWSLTEGIKVYNVINVSTTANNFLPLPSAEGSLQIVIDRLLSGLSIGASGANSNGSDSAAVNTIFLWRFFSKYLGVIISVIFLVFFGFNVKRKQNKKEAKKYSLETDTFSELVF